MLTILNIQNNHFQQCMQQTSQVMHTVLDKILKHRQYLKAVVQILKIW